MHWLNAPVLMSVKIGLIRRRRSLAMPSKLKMMSLNCTPDACEHELLTWIGFLDTNGVMNDLSRHCANDRGIVLANDRICRK